MEDILIPFFVFGFIALIVKMSLDYSKWKKTHMYGGKAISGDTEDNSLGVSELQNLIQEAVYKANLPLMERISDLEQQLRDERVPLKGKKALKQLQEPAPDEES